MNVLVTGGAGYIGAHAALRLLEDGHAVTIVDNLVNGHRAAIDQLAPLGDLVFVEADVADTSRVTQALKERRIDLVMHFAAFAEVGQSVEDPLRYYRNNVGGTLALLEAMRRAEVRRLIFSSTCATYGVPTEQHIPIRESCPQQPINPYGWSKLMVERVLIDHTAANREAFQCAILRYFNVAGADPQARIGEDHHPETHLVPICLETALGKRPHLAIFGSDYPTPDGTCIRDYMHVMDLVDAHIAAMNALAPGEVLIANVGIGHGYSVREVVNACRQVTGREIPVIEADRRPGDPPVLYAMPERLRQELAWTPRHTTLEQIISSAWKWMVQHPDGYAEPASENPRPPIGLEA